MTPEEKDRLKSISEGIRRGLAPVTAEPIPSRIAEALRLLRQNEKPTRKMERELTACG
ncbi:MAG TPA: hypothetical protein VJ740_16110 [Hyphomicrobiaceae bacterium]|nr:hypothetical protein [Hyphomicrobiaceae bacterium]